MAGTTATTARARREHHRAAGAGCGCAGTGVVSDGARLRLCECNVTAEDRRRHAFRIFNVLRLGRGRLGVRSVDVIAAAPQDQRDEALARLEGAARFFGFADLDELLDIGQGGTDALQPIAAWSWANVVRALRGYDQVAFAAGKAVA